MPPYIDPPVLICCCCARAGHRSGIDSAYGACCKACGHLPGARGAGCCQNGFLT